jgi:transposase-like protein
VAALAREYGLHRQKIYDARRQAEQALGTAFAARSAAKPGTFTLQVSEADIARTVIALRVATPSSIRDEVALLPVIYGTGWSYGKIQAVLVAAEKEAAEQLRMVDLSPVRNVALDEMFSQGKRHRSNVAPGCIRVVVTHARPNAREILAA